jgi:hypothetical protein
LHTLLCPFTDSGEGIPDLDMTPTVMKPISFSSTLEVNVSGASFLFIFRPWNTISQISVWVATPSYPQYTFLKQLPPDEELSESYRSARLVSGGISIKSNTISGATFSVAGLINHVMVQTMPPMSSLNFSSLVSYARDAGCVARNVGVENGTLGLVSPSGNNPFLTPGYPGTLKYDTSTYSTNTGTSANWTLALAATGNIFLDNTGATFPLNYSGRIRVQAKITHFGPAIPKYFVLRVYGSVADAVTYVPADFLWTTSTAYYIGTPDLTTTYLNLPMVYVENMTYIEIFAGWTGASTINVHNSSSITVECLDYYSLNQKEPCHLVGVSNLGVGQSIDMMGILNYEAVPDTTLSRNVTVRTEVEDPLDMELTEAVFSTSGRGGIQCVYTNRQYEELLTSGYFRRIATRGGAYKASPAHIRRKLSALWGAFDPETQNLVKGLMSKAAYTGGSALGGYLGGPGGAIAGGSMADAFSRHVMKASGPEGLPSYKATWPNNHPVVRPTTVHSLPERKSKGKEEDLFSECETSDCEDAHVSKNLKEILRVVQDVARAADDSKSLPKYKASGPSSNMAGLSTLSDALASLENVDVADAIFNPDEYEGMDKERVKQLRRMGKEPKLPNRADLILGVNPRRNTMARNSCAFVVVAEDNSNGIIVTVSISSLRPKSIPRARSNEPHTPQWHNFDLQGSVTMHVETTLYNNESVAFFAGLFSFIDQNALIAPGHYFLSPSYAMVLTGPSHQLAVLAAVVGADGNGVFTGAVTFKEWGPVIGPVGDIDFKLMTCVTNKRPLIFPLDDYSDKNALQEAISILSEAVGRPIVIPTPSALIAGVGARTSGMVVGVGISSIAEAWIAQVQLSKLNKTINAPPPPVPGAPDSYVTKEDTLKLFEEITGIINTMVQASVTDPSWSHVLKSIEDFKMSRDINVPSVRTSFHRKKEDWMEKALMVKFRSFLSGKKGSSKKSKPNPTQLKLKLLRDKKLARLGRPPDPGSNSPLELES